MIGKPTNCMGKSSSCIELIFSSNVNLTRNCGIVTLQKNVITTLTMGF